MGQKIKCEFNIFNEGRKYSGNHRSYILENVQSVCLSAATEERIRQREALGFYGHGRRIIAKKMNLGEVEAVKMPDGSTVLLSNIPSNVTTGLEVLEDGTVRHEQEILDTESGRIVTELQTSRVGGFSWACPGSDGGKLGATKISGFAGFDYVLNPGFSMNRGYVLESADGSEITMDAIMESVAKVTGIEDSRVEGLVKGWTADAYFKALELEDQLANAGVYEAALLEKLNGQERELGELSAELQAASKAQQEEREHREAMVKFIVESSPFFIPEDVQHAMMEHDFDKARTIFDKAKAVDFKQVPVPVSGEGGASGKAVVLDSGRVIPEYGTPEAAWEL